MSLKKKSKTTFEVKFWNWDPITLPQLQYISVRRGERAGKAEASLPEAANGGSPPEAPNGCSPPKATNGGSLPEAPNCGSPPKAPNCGSPPKVPNGCSPPKPPNCGSPPEAPNSCSPAKAPNGGSPPKAPNGGSSPERRAFIVFAPCTVTSEIKHIVWVTQWGVSDTTQTYCNTVWRIGYSTNVTAAENKSTANCCYRIKLYGMVWPDGI